MMMAWSRFFEIFRIKNAGGFSSLSSAFHIEK